MDNQQVQHILTYNTNFFCINVKQGDEWTVTLAYDILLLTSISFVGPKMEVTVPYTGCI